MKIIRNKILPIGHHDALNLFGVLFVKGNIKMSPQLLNHENIHSQQMRELLWVFFYILYLCEWVMRVVQFGGNMKKAYFAVSFEREAYANDHNLDYLKNRRRFAQWR